eukprot:TRINITY_DN1737_c0_g1_i4.p1 TRINITY_DN1737_c0_g1~~TRINITY_DN1737_c0_g1_i4.p1  ORF type:complete len:450 (-),score=46.53 TRINITY_DN1737_c0_g1_i4:93-1442(-)
MKAQSKTKIGRHRNEDVWVCSEDILNWTEVTVAPDMGGHQVTLYYYNQQWLLATKTSPDASDSLLHDFDRRRGKLLNPFLFLEEQLEDPKEAARCDAFEVKMQAVGCFSVAQEFWTVWHKLGYELPSDISKCYTFELCSSRFPRLVHYPSDALLLLGVFGKDGIESDSNLMATAMGWQQITPQPLEKFLSSFDDASVEAQQHRRSEPVRPFWVRKPIPSSAPRWRNRRTRRKVRTLAAVQSLATPLETESEESTDEEQERIIYQLLRCAARVDPMQNAGLIVCDTQNHRLRIETPQLRVLRHMFFAKEEASSRAELLEMIKLNPHTASTMLAYYPEWAAWWTEEKQSFDEMMVYLSTLYTKCLHEDARAYHLWCAQLHPPLPAAFHQCLRGLKADNALSVHDGLALYPISKFIYLRDVLLQQHIITSFTPTTTSTTTTTTSTTTTGNET